MNEKKIDARGMLCPKPLIMVKKALTEMQAGERLQILLDNDTSRENVMRFLQDNGSKPVSKSENGVITIDAEKAPGDLPSPRAENYCQPEMSGKPFVMVFNHFGMGFGSEELGKILVQGCINALKEVTPLPAAILLFNGGVHLACEGSPVLSPLSDLESRGAKLLVCGTCLDYYELKTKLKVGRISNMYDILQTIASAGTVFTP